MGKYEVIRNMQAMERWRQRTGNTTYKGIHRDSRTKKAEEQMHRKPYGMKDESLDGSHA